MIWSKRWKASKLALGEERVAAFAVTCLNMPSILKMSLLICAEYKVWLRLGRGGNFNGKDDESGQFVCSG